MSTLLEILRLKVGQQGTNCYLVWDVESLQGVVIDPGDDATTITEELSRHNVQLVGIYLTHGHFDHVLGVLELTLATGAPVYLHPADQFLLDRAQSTAEHFLHNIADPIPHEIRHLSAETPIALGDTKMRIIHTPGHTPGSVCFMANLSDASSEKNNRLIINGRPHPTADLLFSGDTLLPEEKTDLSHRYSSKKAWFTSIAKLQQLDSQTLVLPGHGEVQPLGWYRLDQIHPPSSSPKT